MFVTHMVGLLLPRCLCAAAHSGNGWDRTSTHPNFGYCCKYSLYPYMPRLFRLSWFRSRLWGGKELHPPCFPTLSDALNICIAPHSLRYIHIPTEFQTITIVF